MKHSHLIKILSGMFGMCLWAHAAIADNKNIDEGNWHIGGCVIIRFLLISNL